MKLRFRIAPERGRCRARNRKMKMQTVIYTQRVEIVEGYGERRDCADQNIPRFLQSCGYLPIPVPNICDIVQGMIDEIRPTGIVLTGGNSLCKYGGNAPERDEAERKMLEIAIERNIPVYGFCRGMQVILDYYGCPLVEVKGHVAVRHTLAGVLGGIEVNSFHNQACMDVSDSLEVLAKTEDGVVEAVRAKYERILATMWHPEREQPFVVSDMDCLKKLFS